MRTRFPETVESHPSCSRDLRIAVLMPSFNEGERLAGTLREIASELDTAADGGVRDVTVFVVDDGSPVLVDRVSLLGETSLAGGRLRVVVARHSVNLGQGAAIETARRLALDPRWAPMEGAFDAFVMMDADGQHRARDAFALARAIGRGADVALGDRFGGASVIPWSRRVLLQLARAFERLTTGLVLADAHNGLRAFGPRAIVRMRLRQNRMAHATELTQRISRAARARTAPLTLVEVPVSIRYTQATLAKGQTALGAVSILVDLFQAFLFGPSEEQP